MIAKRLYLACLACVALIVVGCGGGTTSSGNPPLVDTPISHTLPADEDVQIVESTAFVIPEGTRVLVLSCQGRVTYIIKSVALNTGEEVCQGQQQVTRYVTGPGTLQVIVLPAASARIRLESPPKTTPP